MKKIISIILVVLWMSLIFIMSSANSTESNNQSGYVVTFIANILNINNLEQLNHIIRKIAHLSEYFILGILVSNMNKLHNKNEINSIIICIIYAISDEIHQALVPGRNPQITDVLIDSIGSTLGILLLNTKNILYKLKMIK